MRFILKAALPFSMDVSELNNLYVRMLYTFWLVHTTYITSKEVHWKDFKKLGLWYFFYFGRRWIDSLNFQVQWVGTTKKNYK